MERFFWGRCQIVLPTEGVIHITKWSSIYPCKQNTHLAATQLEKGCKCSAEFYTLSMHSVRNVQTPAPVSHSLHYSLWHLINPWEMQFALIITIQTFFHPSCPKKCKPKKGEKAELILKVRNSCTFILRCVHTNHWQSAMYAPHLYIYIYLCVCVKDLVAIRP